MNEPWIMEIWKEFLVDLGFVLDSVAEYELMVYWWWLFFLDRGKSCVEMIEEVSEKLYLY